MPTLGEYLDHLEAFARASRNEDAVAVLEDLIDRHDRPPFHWQRTRGCRLDERVVETLASDVATSFRERLKRLPGLGQQANVAREGQDFLLAMGRMAKALGIETAEGLIAAPLYSIQMLSPGQT